MYEFPVTLFPPINQEVKSYVNLAVVCDLSTDQQKLFIWFAVKSSKNYKVIP